MRTYQKLTPLTPGEQWFAEENHWVIEWFFDITGYDISEWYDVAVFGYLKAVKSWCVREELHRYCFSTIAKRNMQAYIGNDKRKAERRIQAVSLDAPLSEDGSFCYHDIVTYDNYLNCYTA